MKLKDKTELKGYLSEVSDENFTIVNESDNSTSKIAYPQVKQVKGNNLSAEAKIAIGVGIFATLLVIAALTSKGP